MSDAANYPAKIRPRQVYYFSSDKIDTAVRHYFVCIQKADNEVLWFSCCTSQAGKREAYHEKKGYSLVTLVAINPIHAGAKFTDSTYVDCNSVIPYTMEEFTTICASGRIEYKGVLDEDYYYQILVGLQASEEIDEELKETLPKPDDF